MHSELHGYVVHHGFELLLPVSMLFLLVIPKSLLILKEILYTCNTLISMSVTNVSGNAWGCWGEGG